MDKKFKFYITGVLILVIVGLAVTGLLYLQKERRKQQQDQSEINEIIQQTLDICEKIKKIDGLCFTEDEEPGVYAVMIENHVDSRPPSGLAEASLVYEAIVESPITRFLAVFSADKVIEKIGPVRSARPFYVDWAREFNGPYVHVGGSNEALDLISKVYSFDLNEFSSGQYFWRSWLRRQPHNVYTSSELITKAVDNKGWQPAYDFESWKFKPDTELVQRGKTKKITVDFATRDFTIDWYYDRENNNYQRYQAGQEHEDSDGAKIKAKNIAIIYTESTVIDSYGRRKTTTIGSAKAIVFLDGQVIQATWKRPNLTSRTRFYNQSGQEILFNSGKTWIEVVPDHFPKVVVEEDLEQMIQ
ncbi:DUF3048 domain-containing protein [Candidatus Falkowbacteria bacterium]|jgi:hypothetical protein|nr:DUF3048 domain-containing protein [Candidatus Falkowbacteria bacterium]MBT6573987.1 DUF3048 domain-containing protein [Candidatus Falkowbacteria bacterium]MBT7348432.1 DUF3048 domain-containing protein [Candidatus Falkowbacteria bacterium]MBT7500614.1 DUF3048 domain-containing protein [Candidatus Falkowbacteria bacterium]